MAITEHARDAVALKAKRSKQTRKRFFGREAVAGYLFISPWIIGFLLFYLYPLLNTIYNSFTRYKLFGKPQWIGFQNYEQLLFHDPVFAATCWHMLLYVTASTVIYIVGGLALALLLSRAFPGNHFFRTVLYLPSLMVGVAIGSMFVQVFNAGEYGLFNTILGLFGIAPVNWLNNYNNPEIGLVALIFVNFWFVGGTMLIFIAGLKGISQTYYEAARIDGAGAWHRFRYITLPLLTPVILFNTIMTLIGHIQVFDTALIFAGGGSGSVGVSGLGSVLGYHNSLSTFLTYLYQQAFVSRNYGYGSALAVVIFLITLVLTIVVLLIFRRSGNTDRW
ncbi:multiple sugar transport system permease protein [Thermosporothrix hazakensis]|jgi:multiple sugar transport system permease protein|uniref:Multiple sugar transport system permease protein n=2 Tax=Thermosporothrix TaxID=768650 RepID=A0A326UAS2_THEHA|nr:sugar ABC transporter permease [Thermosporothrix hazakensis]PZW32768.1 multiple sugar transport system permease protein [Thermosporothrix hazakensis]BBH87683.1 sugar ABC transporter permease [Thermosporothrix sp. COM3]GCE50125.1 sugar ABC transporter permease [Thermosporothrix hazakensis]